MKLTHQAVREVIASCGPLTGAEVAEFFPLHDRRNVGSVLARLRSAANKQIHILRWETTQTPIGARWAPVYAIGNSRCAKRPPKPSNAEYLRARRRRLAERAQMIAAVPNSVWQLGALQ